jgi:hypothetical protein
MRRLRANEESSLREHRSSRQVAALVWRWPNAEGRCGSSTQFGSTFHPAGREVVRRFLSCCSPQCRLASPEAFGVQQRLSRVCVRVESAHGPRTRWPLARLVVRTGREALLQRLHQGREGFMRAKSAVGGGRTHASKPRESAERASQAPCRGVCVTGVAPFGEACPPTGPGLRREAGRTDLYLHAPVSHQAQQ